MKKRLAVLMFLSFISKNSMAEKCCNHPRDNFRDLSDLNKKFEGSWNSANIQDIANSPCKNKKPPSEKEMKDFLNEGLINTKQAKKINGIQFQDEDPALLKLFSDLHHPGVLAESLKPNFHSSCKKVLCATQEIYGKKEGLQLLYMLQKYGYNGSDRIAFDSSPWKAEELDDALTMFSDYPSSFFPVAYNKQFTHFTRGKKNENGENTLANAMVEVFDKWGTYSHEERQSTLFHEIGHNLGMLDKKDESAEWLNLSKWKGKTTVNNTVASTDWTMGDSKAAVSLYGGKNPTEDFAETVVAYRYNGNRLKLENRLKYDYMKSNIFDGIEYDSIKNCSLGTHKHQKTQKMQALVAELIPKSLPAPASLSEDHDLLVRVQDACRKDMLLSLGDSSASGVETCLRQKMGSSYLQKLAQEKGLSEFDSASLNSSSHHLIPFSNEHYKSVATQLKKNMSKELEQTLLAGNSGFAPVTVSKKSAILKNNCKNISQNIYQAFEAQPVNDSIYKEDIFFFYNQKDSLTPWATKVCSSVKNQNSLTKAIEENIP